MKRFFRSKFTLTIAVLLVMFAASVAIPLSVSVGNVHAATLFQVRSDVYAKVEPPISTYLGKYSPTVRFTCQSPLSVKRCFGPQDFYKVYNINPLLNKGITGKGRTIVILDANQAPTISQDLHTFDKFFGLPDPTLNIFTPEGTPLPTTDATETTLDVELAHAIAPRATINLVLARSLSNVDLFNATAFIVNNNLGDVFSESIGENETADPAFVQAVHQLFIQAKAQQVSLFVSSGDTGSAQTDPTTGLPVLAVGYPASDPLVTAVGGTALYVNSKGQYVSETSWNNSSFDAPPENDATSGGFSVVFSRPAYQNGVSSIGNHRGVPDVAYDADNINSGAIIICSSCGLGPDAVILTGGTSAGTPQWAGITALADQFAGKRLGFLNTTIYAIGKNSANYSQSFHDVRIGNNTFDFEINGSPGQVTGFSTQKGWDPVTGWGSPNVANLLPML
ncbi:MAG TPA: S53 family peptidase [Ktedonobacteraceae bacterium]|nr:S53 family peptidase [Ktedonobacteraceae bacterium]